MIFHKHKYFGIVGWSGTVAVISAYGLINFTDLSPKSLTYLVLNLFGLAGIMSDGFYHKAYESVTVNAIFIILTVVALIRLS